MNNSKENEEIKESAEEKKAQAIAQEAKLLLEKKVRCTMCEKVIKTKATKNGSIKRLESDFDLRPRFANIDTVKYDVTSCPYCGYTAMPRYFDRLTPIQKKLIQEQVCDNFKSLGEVEEPPVYDYDTAIRRYKLALLNTVIKKGEESERAYTCLKIAWLYRGKAECLEQESTDYEQVKEECKKQEEVFYQQAYDGFTTAVSTEMFPICGMDQSTLDYMLATMSWYYKKYDMASKCISNIQSDPEASKKIKEKAYDLKVQIVADMKKEK